MIAINKSTLLQLNTGKRVEKVDKNTEIGIDCKSPVHEKRIPARLHRGHLLPALNKSFPYFSHKFSK